MKGIQRNNGAGVGIVPEDRSWRVHSIFKPHGKNSLAIRAEQNIRCQFHDFCDRFTSLASLLSPTPGLHNQISDVSILPGNNLCHDSLRFFTGQKPFIAQ